MPGAGRSICVVLLAIGVARGSVSMVFGHSAAAAEPLLAANSGRIDGAPSKPTPLPLDESEDAGPGAAGQDDQPLSEDDTGQWPFGTLPSDPGAAPDPGPSGCPTNDRPLELLV